MLKQSASFVLASLRGSTYRSVRLVSSLAAALLDGLFEHPAGHLLVGCGSRELRGKKMSTQQPAGDDAKFVRVQREDFSVDAEINRVRGRSKRIGGIAIFLGTARDRSKGKDVDSITFEHYEGMAQKKLREIRERALKDFDIIEVAILHRYGEIGIGENIVLIVVGAEHRAEAFRACTWAIDELKQITPIWKLEHTPEGEVWVEEHP